MTKALPRGIRNNNPGKSAAAEAEFTRYFGARPDADLRADTRNDETHRIVAW